jgi:hypothetical protein
VVVGQADTGVVRATVTVVNEGTLRIFLARLVESCGERKTPFTILADHMARLTQANAITKRITCRALGVMCARLIEFDILHTFGAAPAGMMVVRANTFTFDTCCKFGEAIRC